VNTDKRATRIQVSAEEARRTEEARVKLKHEQEQLKLQRERQKLFLEEEKQQARENARRKRQIQRQHARQKLARRIEALMPTLGRRMLITVPIVAPMTVAWIGQISFAMETLGWMFIGALIFAAAWELTTAFAGWMYHQARKAGDRGTLFRVATWVFATSAGAMNYWHALGAGASIWKPTPKAVSYGAMSLVGIALWELYSSLIHRKHLRAAGKVSSARPRFGILRWLRFSRITWTAWSLSVRYGIQTVDAAWSQAVAEVERRDHLKAVERERKQREKDDRPDVRVTVVRTVDHTFAAPKTTLRLYRVDALGSTYDHPTATTPQSVDATTPLAALPETASTGRVRNDVHPDASSDHRDHPVDATTTASSNRDRTRPQRKTTRRGGRDQVDATTKQQPTTEDNERAVTAYLESVRRGQPLSKRALAGQFGFSPSWALKRIQEAGPRPVGGGRETSDRPDATAPKDHPVTSEVKTG
jgi:hypothetical protein